MRGRPRLAALAIVVMTAACAQQPAEQASTDQPPVEDPVGFDAPERRPAAAPSPVATPSPAAAPSPVEPAAPSSQPTDDEPGPFAVVLAWDGIEVRLPSSRTAIVGLHQSNHDGARDLTAIAAPPVPVQVLPDRGRGTGLRGAADIVAHPDTELRAPVTGTVKRAGTYRLYCDQFDDFLVIEPDGRPGIEVKLLHIDGVQVAAGDRVLAAETVVAPRPTTLPFASQVDDISSPDDWPHVHLEVVDTAIPDRPNANSGSDDC